MNSSIDSFSKIDSLSNSFSIPIQKSTAFQYLSKNDPLSIDSSINRFSIPIQKSTHFQSTYFQPTAFQKSTHFQSTAFQFLSKNQQTIAHSITLFLTTQLSVSPSTSPIKTYARFVHNYATVRQPLVHYLMCRVTHLQMNSFNTTTWACKIGDVHLC